MVASKPLLNNILHQLRTILILVNQLFLADSKSCDSFASILRTSSPIPDSYHHFRIVCQSYTECGKGCRRDGLSRTGTRTFSWSTKAT